MPPLRRLVLLLLTAVLLPLPALAGDNLNLAAEIDALTVAVNRLATVVEQQQKSGGDAQLQRLTQAIAYLNLRWRRIERLEHDIDNARTLREDFELASKSWGERIRDLEEELQGTQGPARAELERRMDDYRARQEIARKRVTRAEDDLLTLENRVRELQNELVDIETYVQQNLKF